MALRQTNKPNSHETSPCRQAPPLRDTSTRNAANSVAWRKLRRKPRYKRFHQVVDHLHKLLPARFPVDVQLGRVNKRILGDCGLWRHRFCIRVSSRLSQWCAIEVLIHEWAHALAWPRRERHWWHKWQPYSRVGPIHHDAAWGQAYAKVYSVVLFDIIPRIRKAEQAARRLRHRGRRK